MLYGVLDTFFLNNATAVLPGSLDRALGCLGVGRLRRQRQAINAACILVSVSALGLIRSMLILGYLDRMVWKNFDDRTCNQVRRQISNHEIVAVSICWRS